MANRNAPNLDLPRNTELTRLHLPDTMTLMYRWQKSNWPIRQRQATPSPVRTDARFLRLNPLEEQRNDY
jgi:hypothetical protein